MEKLTFFLGEIGGKILVPFGGDLLYLGINGEHFFRGINEGHAFIGFAVTALHIALFLQRGKGAGHVAFVDADVTGKLLLRNAGVMVDGEDITMMTSGKLTAFHLICAVHRAASADDIDASHDRGHKKTPFFHFFVSDETVANATN